MQLQDLYAAHLAEQMRRADVALASGGFEQLLIPAGIEHYGFLDDQSYPFRSNPHFLAWVPLHHHPGSWIAYAPGRKPVLAYHQPEDYWHAPPDAAVGDVRPNNPDAVILALHWERARKTPYEIARMRNASRRGASGHLAALEAFREGASEHQIHLEYCAAAGHTEQELPYQNIVALNQHAAILHYHHSPAPRPPESRSFLIDAGGSDAGYASDITRTHARTPGAFADLIAAVDGMQQELVGQMRAGRDYRELHIECHHRIGRILKDTGIVRMEPESQLERGITGTFFPHGLGHFLGLQVHDVGGFQAGPDGGLIAKPEGHPYLRLTRTLEPGHVVTVEPGIYFIPMLLAKLRESTDADAVNWPAVEAMLPYGGIRIEDDVHVTEGAPENLTRDAFRAVAA